MSQNLCYHCEDTNLYSTQFMCTAVTTQMNINQIPCGVCQVFKYFATQMLKYYLQSKCLRSSSANVYISISYVKHIFFICYILSNQSYQHTNIYYRHSTLKVDFIRKI